MFVRNEASEKYRIKSSSFDSKMSKYHFYISKDCQEPEYDMVADEFWCEMRE